MSNISKIQGFIILSIVAFTLATQIGYLVSYAGFLYRDIVPISLHKYLLSHCQGVWICGGFWVTLLGVMEFVNIDSLIELYLARSRGTNE